MNSGEGGGKLFVCFDFAIYSQSHGMDVILIRWWLLLLRRLVFKGGEGRVRFFG